VRRGSHVAEKGMPALESTRLRVSKGQASRCLEKHACADASKGGDNGGRYVAWHRAACPQHCGGLQWSVPGTA
jgi:hypothetical protein